MAEKLIAELGWVSHFYDRDVEAILKQRCEKDDVDSIPTLLNRSMQFLHDNKRTSYWHLVYLYADVRCLCPEYLDVRRRPGLAYPGVLSDLLGRRLDLFAVLSKP